MCISLYTSVIHNTAQNSSDNLPSYPLNNHHSSHDVYCRAGKIITCTFLSRRKSKTSEAKITAHVRGGSDDKEIDQNCCMLYCVAQLFTRTCRHTSSHRCLLLELFCTPFSLLVLKLGQFVCVRVSFCMFFLVFASWLL